MRTIKFRGKDNHGTWRYGYLVCLENKPSIYFQVGKGEVKSMDWVYVKPKSVGQFTGLYDKDGKEIYEGDILKGMDNTLYKVVYSENCGTFTMVTNNRPVPFNMYQNILKDFNYHVVGNSHDNPELIN